MGAIKEIFSTYGPEYISRFSHAMPREHRKVIHAVSSCRSAEHGMIVYTCRECGKSHTVFRSCGNRHCPTCQSHKARQWLAGKLENQLPTHHFMITFTVPEQMRAFIRSNQRISYEAMFKASSSTIKTLAANERFAGGDIPGFFGVLHTWGRQLAYHPHIHYIVPGGAFSSEDNSWHASRPDFFVPVRALSALFKPRFKDEMKKAGLYASIPSKAWEPAWNVNSQPVGKDGNALRYLAPYVFKVAISDSRIKSVENNLVSFHYKKHGSNRLRTMTLSAMEFLHRFLQHVLPTGFMKVRYYGFMHASSRVSLRDVILAVEIDSGFSQTSSRIPPEPLVYPVCPICGGKLVHLYSILAFQKRSAMNSS